MAQMRLDKFLSDAGIASRRELKDIIKSGRVFVDGRAEKKPECKIDSDINRVTVDGRAVGYAKYRYFMLDKPLGVVTATEDREEKTVLDILPPELKNLGLFPVGRLDKDTGGLLILTNDGDFAHRVISPKFSVEKRYYAQVEEELKPEDVRAFAEGITLKDGTQCKSAKLIILSPKSCELVLTEGKYHQVRRMIASRGNRVNTLRRLSIGGLELEKSSAPGDCTELDKSDLCRVFRASCRENNQNLN